jgi:hypothetical protein
MEIDEAGHDPEPGRIDHAHLIGVGRDAGRSALAQALDAAVFDHNIGRAIQTPRGVDHSAAAQNQHGVACYASDL